jgi:hypothetical protein
VSEPGLVHGYLGTPSAAGWAGAPGGPRAAGPRRLRLSLLAAAPALPRLPRARVETSRLASESLRLGIASRLARFRIPFRGLPQQAQTRNYNCKKQPAGVADPNIPAQFSDGTQVINEHPPLTFDELDRRTHGDTVGTPMTDRYIIYAPLQTHTLSTRHQQPAKS